MAAQDYYNGFDLPNQQHSSPATQQSYAPGPPDYNSIPPQVQTPPQQFNSPQPPDQPHFMTASHHQPSPLAVYQQNGQQPMSSHPPQQPTSYPQQYQNQYPQSQPVQSQPRPSHIRIQEPIHTPSSYDSDSSDSSRHHRHAVRPPPNAYAHLRPSRSYSEPPAQHSSSRHSHRRDDSRSPSRDRNGERERERSSRHSSHASHSSKSTRSKGKRTNSTTGAFLGSLGGGLLGDAILPGLGTLGGALLGGYRGYEVGKGPKSKRHASRSGHEHHHDSRRDDRRRSESERDERDGRSRGRGVYDSENESDSDDGRSVRSSRSGKSLREKLGHRDTYEEEYQEGRRRRGEL